jgi:hypothetical protein
MLTFGLKTTLEEQPVTDVAERLKFEPVTATIDWEVGFEQSGLVLTPTVLTCMVPLTMGSRGN